MRSPGAVPLLSSLTGPERTAVTIDGAELTRRELLRRATATAAGLRDSGVRRVAVHAAPTPETVIALVGCLLSGTTAVPVPPDAGASELAHVLSDAEPDGWLGSVPPDPGGLPVRPVAADADPLALPEPDPAGPALILYTSGTTGPPKGVVLSGAALAAGIDALTEAWQWTADDTLVHGLPLFHVHGLVLGLFGPLRIGSPLVHTGRPTPEAYASTAGTLYFGVPTVWSRIVAQPDLARRLAKARLLVSGSAPLPTQTFHRLAELTGAPPVERYGMSETLITISTRADGERRPGWVGLPLPGVRTRLRDDAGRELPHDGETIGSLEVAGPMIFDGYLGRPDATAAAITDDGYVRTGDAAVIDAAGFHKIVGRESTDLIKSGGYRIGAGEIESCLREHPAVADVAVIGVPDDDLGQRIVAYVVGDGDPGELINHVGSRLARHKRPREVRFVPELPRNALGKVQKHLLA
ncbi:acyl-CoA synthetase [Microlunatus parietis]|uniref:Fatty acid CoA ligase FadD36 n=1 Tax=Microlunatus parietis TaxID=682979 RepID=A0A7Y9I7F4_9ACTN|nr:acyl-CoA synthetase [Microlunatus parietis]NYE71455.1 fatty acid CoA ligase FadD36 [Microlunatus parietis]